MFTSYSIKQRSLTGGGGDDGKTEGVVAKVKSVEKSPSGTEKKVKVKLADEKFEGSFYVPKKYADRLKPEKVYEFHLDEPTYRGGSAKNFSGANMIRRTKVAPKELGSSSFGAGGGGLKGR